MRRFLILLVLVAVGCTLMAQDVPAYSIDKDEYRRSSLCLILLTHRDKELAAEMESVFQNFPLPARYNEHNITGLRVIGVTGKQKKEDIDKLIRNNAIAQRVVGRWFDRGYDGEMNMSLIHDRGGYGASHEDYIRASENIRGTAMLRDEGIELLQSTFVLVCDMDYVDKSAITGATAAGLIAGGIILGGIGAVTKDKKTEKITKVAALGAGAAGLAVSQIGGFKVKMNAYLYKLQWDDKQTQRMYNDFWVDADTPKAEAEERSEDFDMASKSFHVDFIGEYHTTSSKTVLTKWKVVDEVILDVCERCVNEGLTKLAEKFDVFKPRSPFYIEEGNIYSHIGTKEEVVKGRKYDIIQPYKDDKGQICWNQVGQMTAQEVWDNKEIRFDDYFDCGEKGSLFRLDKAKIDITTPGLQIRETK